MKNKIGRISFLIILIMYFSVTNFSQTIEDAKLLQGVWQAQSINAGGKEFPAESAKNMQFTFKENKLTIKGNFGDSRTTEFDYNIDQTQSPKHLNVLFPEQKGSILAIYELKEDMLKVCIKNSDGLMARPQGFEKGSVSNLTVIVFSRQKNKFGK